MKKAVKVLTTAALLASLAAPFAAPVYAAKTVSSNPTSVGDNGDRDLGDIYIEANINELKDGDTVNVRLPDDFTLFPKGASVKPNDTSSDGVVDFRDLTVVTAANKIEIQGNVGAAPGTATTFVTIDVPTTKNGFGNYNIEAKLISDKEIQLVYHNTNWGGHTVTTGSELSGYLYVRYEAGKVYVPAGVENEIKAYLEAPSGGGFPTGSVTVARKTSANATAAVDTVKSITGNDTLNTIRITEDRAGAFDAQTNASTKRTITLKLPKGMTWDVPNTVVTGDWGLSAYTVGAAQNAVASFANPAAGTNIAYGTVSGNERELIISIGQSTGTQGVIKVLPAIKVDEDEAKFGDITIDFGGETSVNNDDLVVGKYSDWGTGVKEKSSEEIVAGRDAKDLGEFYIEENGPGSLITNRTITLTLPEGVKWDTKPTVSTEQGDATLDAGTVSDDKSKVTFRVTKSSTAKSTKFRFKDAKVTVAVDKAAGDVNLEVGGTAQVKGTVKVASILPVVTGEIASVNPLKIGVQDQLLGDIVLKEGKKEALIRNGKVALRLPEGVTFSAAPKVEVTEGDIEIVTDSVKREDNNREVTFQIKNESGKPSTIKLSNVKVNVTRYVPEGPIEIAVQGPNTGSSALYTTGATTAFPNSTKAATITGAKVITPAPGDVTASNIVFKLNSKTYTVDGTEMTMDAAPLVGWDRAYLPVRFAANALNVSDSNIIWDDRTNTFTVFKGDRVVTGKVGDKFLTVNGAKVPMDVPVWRNKVQTNNRVMVPIRYLANALNANIEWNKETSEITIEASK